MKILITGATGFIGSHLAERLAKEEYNVRALVRKKELDKENNKKENFELLKKLRVNIYFGDLLDKESLNKVVKDIDVIFHLAAIARPMAIPNKLYFDVNETGTKNLLEACKNKQIKKIIIMSSISAVGPTRDSNPVNEKTKCYPEDIYGWSKLAQEKIAFEYLNKYKLPIILLRPPMVFGPRDFEMLRLFKTIKTGFFPLKSNNECMEFLYVENLVEACILAMQKGKIGEIYHISNEKHYSINEIVKAISEAEEKKILPIKLPKVVFFIGGYVVEFIANIFNFHPPFKHDTVKWMTNRVWYSDISKARKELGYIPKISLKEGVRKTVEYYKEKGFI